MTVEEKLNRIRLLSNNGLDTMFSDDVIKEFIAMAGEEILAWSGVSSEEVPKQWENVQCMAVIVGINQIGVEGAENGSSASIGYGFAYSTMLNFIHAHVPTKVTVL